MKLTAKKIAEYFLFKTDTEVEDYISNLKLQKLVYYAQGFHLAIHGKPLFNDKIVAWTHGPVVENLYHEYKKHGPKTIEPPSEIDFSIYDKRVTELLDDVWDVYGQYSALRLRNLTHEEEPWIEAYRKMPGSEISQKTMERYFKTLLADAE